MNIENIKTAIICILPLIWLWFVFWLYTFINDHSWIQIPFTVTGVIVFIGLFIIALNRFISILGSDKY